MTPQIGNCGIIAICELPNEKHDQTSGIELPDEKYDQNSGLRVLIIKDTTRILKLR
ncbi:hypothetical protein RhiirA5_438344 [Rhizophagus irregularis]|uniref:Uncharacterized protein n=1 Tax=Rhizophagus irregularis TaxID=588596 RepID=A0A2N0NJ94_9GLOM|nr:hypothetical protein RhiirA5_438344 [Rhizophagus irregularis]